MSPGSRFYVEFDCQLLDGVVAGTNYSNATAVDYASRAEAGPDVRDAGSDTVDDDNNNDLDNYRESAAHTLKADATIAIEKSLPGGINRLTIGEAFVYRLRVWVIQGVSPSVVVTDTLADGLSYVSHVVLVPLGGIQFQQQLFAASGQDLSFDFGNVTNAPTGGNGPKDYFDIEITVRVANVTGNQNGITHDNQGTVSFVPVGGPVSEDSNIVTTTVTEPALTVQKTPTPGVQSRGNEVTYQISVSHALVSTAPAHDVLMTDTLPAGLTFVSTTAVDYTQVGQNLTFRKSVINLGETWSFTYIVRVDDDAQLAPPMLNGVELTWAGTPGPMEIWTAAATEKMVRAG